MSRSSIGRFEQVKLLDRDERIGFYQKTVG